MARRTHFSPRAAVRRRGRAFALVLSGASLLPVPAFAAGSPGESIYRERCASCHGESGEGVEGEFSRPLEGDKSVAQLARYIAKRMPKDDPGTCTGDDADQVARYIFDAFYSPIAQARRRPPRLELSRLTVRQYRNAVADLITPPRGMAAGDLASDGRGLRGEYFDSRQPGEARVLERIDAGVRFDFGAVNPAPDALGSKGFAARWRGSLLARATGEHDIIVRTDHAARLWLNDVEEPLIDAWVKSGDDTEYRGKIFLLEGRAYPLRLEFSSRNQGVKKDDETPPVKAFVELWWREPNRIEELIPALQLSPLEGAEVFVVTTPFPPDDRSEGYPRGTAISKAWEEATTAAAIETARYVRDHLERLANPRDEGRDGARRGRGRRERRDRERGEGQTPDPEAAAREQAAREERARAFCAKLVERAFRRPLGDEQRQLYVDRHFAAGVDVETAVQRAVLLALKSPRFLYVDFAAPDPDGWAVAERLSLALWDSLPDDTLRAAAAAGSLASPAEAVRQAARMLDDRRSRSKVREFFHRWLLIEHAGTPPKDAELFPGFDAAVAFDLRTSLDLFLEDAVWRSSGDFRQLLLSEDLYVNGRISRLYDIAAGGAALAADAPFRKIGSPAPERAGILSHPYLLASFAYGDATSPIHRGVFILRGLLGRALRPPPEAFTPLAPDLHPMLTTRERVSLQTEPDSCRSCHALINPLGFALERFDPIGRFREAEKGKRIDASGTYELATGELRTFDGARELGEFLAASGEVHRAFAAQIFHQLVKQPLRAYGPNAPEELAEAFTRDGFDVRRLLVRAAALGALASREALAVPVEAAEVGRIESRRLPGGARIRL